LYLLLRGAGGIGMMICLHAKAWHSTRRVIQFLESLKDVESEQKGNQSSSTTSSFCSDFC
jgi:hypothetical protein